ncbi:fungal-specific transcription factor domain-containing protein [Bisporella sp. PMI_857]|nr:fungal-specific transcription factor domain-containing protein [Bisporella sp. PMI_857]
MSSATPSVKAKSAFSCSQCRKRKVKCGGQQPECSRCTARKETCIYELNPTLSYTQKLEARIKELEDLIDILQPSSVGNNDESRATSLTPGSMSRTFQGLRVDHDGKITYHGATSFFQLPTTDSQNQATIENPSGSNHEEDQRKERLVNNAWQQRIMENLSETPEPFQFMLKAHWCWIQPLFNFVYRPAFTRDMELLGPYYSHTLLNAMMSHSVRWCKHRDQIHQLLVPYDDGELFSKQARTMVFDELRYGQSKIPTVQTLLLLSAQECSQGNRTQAWLYSGMAFRLIEDMGICIDGQKFAGSVRLSDEDIEIRHRLFWSCYFWDKMISLYLGRLPTLQHSMVSPPQVMLDDSAETELWTPHGLEYPDGREYPPTQAHSISCFMRMCRLAEIFNLILIRIYNPLHQNNAKEIQDCLEKEGHALKLWWEDLPTFLRIDAQDLPMHCPPSHIATLNCLYHTFKILLYRPMLFQQLPKDTAHRAPDPQYLVECISSAMSIIAIFDLFCRTFGHNYCVLSLSYSLYTAASIFLLQVQAAKHLNEQDLRRLEFCVIGLNKVKQANPVIGRALVLINLELSKLGIVLPVQSDVQDYIPPENPLLGSTTISDTFISPVIDSQTTLPFHHDEAVGAPSLHVFDPEDLQISSEMLEAFLALEPIDPTVGSMEPFS